LLERPSTSLGRGPNNDLVLDTRRASRAHAIVEREGSQVFITDLHSMNGTLVNGQLIDRRLLVHGDTIEIGSIELRYVAEDEMLSEDAALRLLTAAPSMQPSYQEWDYSATVRDAPREKPRRKR